MSIKTSLDHYTISLKNKITMLNQIKTQEIIKKFGRTKNDTGSPEVQIALMTANISNITGHLKENKKDYQAQRGLRSLVTRRKRLLKYLNRSRSHIVQDLMQNLKIKKI